MTETLNPYPEIFPGLTPEKARILAGSITSIETNLGDNSACMICCVNTPIGVKEIMPYGVIQKIHTFIKNNDHKKDYTLSYHNRGQVTDYFDPQTGMDASDIIIDGLTTNRNLHIYLHGFDEDTIAFRAATKINSLSNDDKRRIFVTVSVDPYGPCNVARNVSRKTGYQRAKNALMAFDNMPNKILRIFYDDDKNKVDQEYEWVSQFMGEYMPMPNKIETWSLTSPTRSNLPLKRKAGGEMGHGYEILVDGRILFREYFLSGRWKNIGTIYDIKTNEIKPLIRMFV